jgi:peptide-methionine (R)-S-oxide reductase
MQIDRRALLLGAGGVALCGVGGSMLLGGRPAEAQNGRFPFTLSDAEWRRRLGPQRYAILREAHTERAGTSPLNNEHRRGTFHCAGCALPLFASATKFDSGTGWPSFWRPLPRAVGTSTDNSFGMRRTEVHCARCGGHLGHVFNDGPRPTGLRYCINGLSLTFRAA